MLRKFNIGPRLLMLIAVQAVILMLVGATAIYGLNAASQSTQLLNDNVTEGTRLDYVSNTLHDELLGTVYSLDSGALTWGEAGELLSFARARSPLKHAPRATALCCQAGHAGARGGGS